MERNPNRYDKKWDVRINERFIFDVKSTVIPREFRDDWMSVVAFPARIVNFYYDKQSRGVRYDMQNRLLSYITPWLIVVESFYCDMLGGQKNMCTERLLRILKV